MGLYFEEINGYVTLLEVTNHALNLSDRRVAFASIHIISELESNLTTLNLDALTETDDKNNILARSIFRISQK